MRPVLQGLTPADRHQVLTAVAGVIDRELAAAVSAMDASWCARGLPADVRALLLDWLAPELAGIRADALAFVRELLTPTHVH